MPGSYTVSLYAENRVGGNSHLSETPIVVKPTIPPTASFHFTPTEGELPLQVDLSNDSQTGTGQRVEYDWDFGDGLRSTEKEPTHIYEESGIYITSLTVTTSHGSDTKYSDQPVKCTKIQMIVYTMGAGDSSDIFVMRVDGSNKTNLTNSPDYEVAAALSPNGEQIVFCIDQDIYLMQSQGGSQQRLTYLDNCSRPSWSPDGKQICFQRLVNGRSDIWTMESDGSGQTNLTSSQPADLYGSASWSWDSQFIACRYNTGILVLDADAGPLLTLPVLGIYVGSSKWQPGSNRILYYYNKQLPPFHLATVSTLGQTTSVTSSPYGVFPAFGFWRPEWSPDGSQIACLKYSVSKTGDDYVFGPGYVCVMNEDGTGVLDIAYSGVAIDAKWSPDSKKVVFESDMSGHKQIYSANADGTNMNLLSDAAIDEWVGLCDVGPAQLY